MVEVGVRGSASRQRRFGRGVLVLELFVDVLERLGGVVDLADALGLRELVSPWREEGATNVGLLQQRLLAWGWALATGFLGAVSVTKLYQESSYMAARGRSWEQT